MRVAGVDGCRGGWVVVTAGPGSELEATVVTGLDAVVADVRAGRLEAIAVDMPIGLLDDRPRTADIEARARLGERRSTVFPAPVRSVLAATSYRQACELSRAACGRALSKQTYNLIEPIRHLDALLGPADCEQVIEAHPELAFARLGGRPLPPKRTPEGRALRTRLLDEALGPPFRSLRQQSVAPLGDLLDAAVLVTTARRLVDGTAVRLGNERDSTGKPVRVVY